MVHNEMLTESQFLTTSFALIDRANTNTDELFVLMPPKRQQLVEGSNQLVKVCDVNMSQMLVCPINQNVIQTNSHL